MSDAVTQSAPTGRAAGNGKSGSPHGPPQYEFYRSLDLDKPAVPDRTRVQLAILRTLGADKPIARILDLGCGDGSQSVLVREMAPLSSLVGVDWSAGALGRASDRGLTLVHAGVDGHSLPFRSNTFDVVIFSEVIEHLVDTDNALLEIRRVLVDGGTLLISTPNLAAWFNRALLLLGVQPLFSEVSGVGVFGRPGRQVAGHLRLFTRRALCELLEFHGLSVLQVDGAAYHELPRAVRWFDRALRRWPAAAAVLVVTAAKQGQRHQPRD